MMNSSSNGETPAFTAESSEPEEPTGFTRRDAFMIASIVFYLAIAGVLVALLTDGVGAAGGASNNQSASVDGGYRTADGLQGAAIDGSEDAVPVERRDIEDFPEIEGVNPSALEDDGYLLLHFDILGSWKFRNASFLDMMENRELAREHNPTPDDIAALSGRPVALTGYPWPDGGERYDIRRFVLFRDLGSCCFGSSPEVNHFINVTTSDGRTVDIVPRMLVTVYGTLTVKVDYTSDGVPYSLYRMVADKVIEYDFGDRYGYGSDRR